MKYVLKDHQGSLAALVNEKSGTEYFSFDAWGRRRNAQTWAYTNMPISFGTTRGFTMHEHLDEFKLININGRVYDPLVGRFISPDPFLQMPDYSQSYNRYSYAFNNPLRFSDPSGFFAEGDSTLSPSRAPLKLPFLPAETRLSYRPGATTNTDNTSLGQPFKGTETTLPTPYPQSKLSNDAEGNAETSGGGGYDVIPINPAVGMGERIVGIASGYVNSTDYNLLNKKDDFLPGNPKCNKFVYDVFLQAGASPGLPNQPGRWGMSGPKPPISAQWANTNYNISGWVVVSSPKPGDAASFSGHIGIVIGNGLTISATEYDGVVRNNWGFRTGQTPVFRRFVGYSSYY